MLKPQKTKLPFIKGDRKVKLDYRDNLPVNFTSVVANIRGDAGYLLTHDGLKEFAITNGKARGAAFNERFNKHYRVSGDFFEEILPDGTVKNLGLTPGSGVAKLSNSFNTQAILTDGNLYLWDDNNLRKVDDPDLGFPIDITWFRGIYVMTDGETLFHTDINNEFAISPFKYSSSEFSSDKILAVSEDTRNQIAAFNRYSTEYFYFDSSAAVGTSVLTPIQAAVSNIGIVGTNCQTLLDGMFFILGGRQNEGISVHIIDQSSSFSVATREIDKIIGKYTEAELESVYMESRVVDRDKFLIIHLPGETLIYNHTVGSEIGKHAAWTYVKSGVETDEVWRAKYGVFDPRAAKWIYGDTKESKLAYLDKEMAAQYGEQVECTCYTPIISNLETASINSFEIQSISGFAGNDFSVSFSMSSNGVTYGREYFNVISTGTAHAQRYIARNLGYVREDFNFKFRFVSVDKMAFSGLEVEFS